MSFSPAANPAARFGHAEPARFVQGLQHLAVDVELELPRGGVADAHRRDPS